MLNWSSLKFSRKSTAAVEHDEVAERDAADEQERNQQEQGQDDAPLAGAEGGEHERVELIEDHRQRQQERRVRRHGQGREERLGHAQGERLASLRQGPFRRSKIKWLCQKHSPEGDHEHGQRDDDPRAQLVEMLDEREPVLVANRPIRAMSLVARAAVRRSGLCGRARPRPRAAALSPACSRALDLAASLILVLVR